MMAGAQRPQLAKSQIQSAGKQLDCCILYKHHSTLHHAMGNLREKTGTCIIIIILFVRGLTATVLFERIVFIVVRIFVIVTLVLLIAILLLLATYLLPLLILPPLLLVGYSE